MTPALTPEEWANWMDTERDHRGHGVFVLHHQPGVVEQVAFRYADGIQIQANDEDAPPRVDLGDTDRHALAALALHGLVVDGEPVGFTRAMLSALESALRYDMTPEEVDQCRALAACIEALLPPEAK